MITRQSLLSSLSVVPALAAMRSLGSHRSAFAAVLDSAETNRRASYAAFHSLPPGAVRPEGWLGLYLEKQTKGLSLHLPMVSWPFTGAFWAGEEKTPSWWPWEHAATGLTVPCVARG